MLTRELANLMRLPVWSLARGNVRRCGGQLPFRIGVPGEIPVKDDFFWYQNCPDARHEHLRTVRLSVVATSVSEWTNER